MAVSFRLARHSILPGASIVEILVDGEVAGVVYPAGEKAVRVISAHIKKVDKKEGFSGEVVEKDGTGNWPPIPHVEIQFDPSPYVISGGRIVRLPKH